MFVSILRVALFLLPIRSLAHPTQCPHTSGDKEVTSYQLYPENAVFDTKRCVAYLSVLYNATVAVYNPYQNSIVDTVAVPGLSGDKLLHSSGVHIDPLDRLSIAIDAGISFDTDGQNVTGDNFLVKYGLNEKRVLWKQDLNAVTNGVYSGFQDIAHDDQGNSFVLGTFPSSIIRVSSDGQVASPWFLATPPDHTIHGFSGIATKGNHLLVTDNKDGQLYRFDICAETGKPTRVPLSTGENRIGEHLDASLLPAKYKGTVLLVSDNVAGTVVLRSDDGQWNSAKVAGTIPNAFLSQGGSTVASLEIGGTIYSVTEFFGDQVVEGTLAGNRTSFPLQDITAKVEDLLK